MCTVTVYRNEGMLRVTMNRDEARTRGPESPPQIARTSNGTAWLAPQDSDSKGTWMGVNECGLIACLLNRYQDDVPQTIPESAHSRGDIIPALMGFDSLAESQSYLNANPSTLSVYPPFTLLLCDMVGGIQLDWIGQGDLSATVLDEPWQMLTSSFFDPGHVLPWRKKAFDMWKNSGAAHVGALPDFHLLQPEGSEAIAPLMTRSISCTRSITQATVSKTDHTIAMHYAPVADGVLDWTTFQEVHALPARLKRNPSSRGH